MKRQAIDYRGFRLSRINEPRFRHLKLLLGWVFYFAMYFITENLIPYEKCTPIHCALDDLIPFNEYFAVFYCYWFALIVFSLLWFMLYDIPSFKRLQVFIMITQAVAMVTYILYPSIQDLRPDVMPRDNFLCRLMFFIYRFDTPTGVCPSLHVAYSLGMASVWSKCKKTPRWWRATVVVSAVVISISTTFVKQHSAVDVFAALPVGMLAEYLVYGRPLARFRLHTRLHAYLSET